MFNTPIANLLLGILMILWGMTFFGLAIPAVLMGILAILTGILLIVERVHTVRSV